MYGWISGWIDGWVVVHLEISLKTLLNSVSVFFLTFHFFPPVNKKQKTSLAVPFTPFYPSTMKHIPYTAPGIVKYGYSLGHSIIFPIFIGECTPYFSCFSKNITFLIIFIHITLGIQLYFWLSGWIDRLPFADTSCLLYIHIP